MTTTAGPISSASTIEVRNPATGEVVGSVAMATRDDVAAAVQRARRAQEAWERAGLDERIRVITRYHDLLLDSQEEIVETVQSESGKSRRDALNEVVTVAGTARYYCAHARQHLRPERHQPAVPLLTTARVVYNPLGVVGLITPWNFPFLLGVADALPALVAGNAVVTKPSSTTPLSALLAGELLLEAGLPRDLFTVLVGPGGEIGNELIKHVDYVGFTGGTEAGRKVAAAAGERLIPCSLELGGKNPMVVLEGARLEDAAHGLLSGAFANSGQTCISIERAYVQDTVFDAFADLVASRARELKVGWSTGFDVDMGSLISAEHADEVESHVRDAVDKGATVLVGGRRRRDLGDAFLEPTVLTDVSDDMVVAREETFGPVVSLYRVSDAREAVQRANDSSFGLNSSVWAGNSGYAQQVARGLRTGSAGVNSTLLIYHSFDVPMGGEKESGIGRRHGRQGILRYTRGQSIVGSYARGGGYESITRHVTSRRRAGLFVRLFRLWRHIPGMR